MSSNVNNPVVLIANMVIHIMLNQSINYLNLSRSQMSQVHKSGHTMMMMMMIIIIIIIITIIISDPYRWINWA
jgi:heme/copper-type cytochrome/quinol oxidase subunit 2